MIEYSEGDFGKPPELGEDMGMFNKRNITSEIDFKNLRVGHRNQSELEKRNKL